MRPNNFLKIAPEVADALSKNKPVVALESTIISHGMPFPKNYETARMVEKTVRDAGAVPATIAVIRGKLKAGLSDEEIAFLGKQGPEVVKASRRDLPWLVANKKNGATTVAATMIIAEMAGIPVFATGGIGGVHRGGAQTFDISADLQELAKTNVAVVCAGAKSILDLKLTLEYLETMGVPVLGFRTKKFPAFFVRSSGLEVDYEVETAEEMAKILAAKWRMNLRGGVVIANPIPGEAEPDYEFINKAIETAVQTADRRGIQGKEITPFLLAEIERITAGKSLRANIELVKNNAKLAAEIAVAYSKIKSGDTGF
ncbi:MAG: pseudouridine-5'-phosphate glycosidase [Bacteroidetes bacterium]|nr:MAG: pseudouridine-5'-phosphate glycosidase [Bacteroidota bacterium]